MLNEKDSAFDIERSEEVSTKTEATSCLLNEKETKGCLLDEKKRGADIETRKCAVDIERNEELSDE